MLVTSHRAVWTDVPSVLWMSFFECDTAVCSLPSAPRERAGTERVVERSHTVNSLYRLEAAPTGAGQINLPSANRRLDLYHSDVFNTQHRTSILSFYRVCSFSFVNTFLFIGERWPRPWFFWPRGLEKPNIFWVVSPRNGYWSCHWKEKVGIPVSMSKKVVCWAEFGVFCVVNRPKDIPPPSHRTCRHFVLDS